MKKILSLFVFASLLTACGEAAPVVPVAPDETISIEDSSFMPKAMTVKVGDTVQWTNVDDTEHTVTSEPFDSGSLAQGGTFSYTFDKAGTFDYACTVHPSMSGTINVQ
jgi:plastocyanin